MCNLSARARCKLQPLLYCREPGPMQGSPDDAVLLQCAQAHTAVTSCAAPCASGYRVMVLGRSPVLSCVNPAQTQAKASKEYCSKHGWPTTGSRCRRQRPRRRHRSGRGHSRSPFAPAPRDNSRQHWRQGEGCCQEYSPCCQHIPKEAHTSQLYLLGLCPAAVISAGAPGGSQQKQHMTYHHVLLVGKTRGSSGELMPTRSRQLPEDRVQPPAHEQHNPHVTWCM